MSVFAVKIKGLKAGDDSLGALVGKVVLVVNVASKCGLTPQYTGLEALQKEYAAEGFSVLGVPCNQFGAQEPGSPEEITTFCSTNYGVTFPMTEKVEVNGPGRHPLYDQLTSVADAEGHSGELPCAGVGEPRAQVCERRIDSVEPLHVDRLGHRGTEICRRVGERNEQLASADTFAAQRSDIERTQHLDERRGVRTGVHTVELEQLHPVLRTRAVDEHRTLGDDRREA